MVYSNMASTLEMFLSQKNVKFKHDNGFLFWVTYFIAV